MTERRYEPIHPITREQALIELDSRNPERIGKALLAMALHYNDYEYVLELCLGYFDHESINVQFSAIYCIGHIARIHRKMDTDRVLPLLEKKRANPELTGTVFDALDDIQMFTSNRDLG